MSRLSRSRRRSRANAKHKSRKRNLSKFIPESDSDFAHVADKFARSLVLNPDRYEVSAAEAEFIDRRVREFRSALAKALHGSTRTKEAIRTKDAARQEAEHQIRRFANIIRANPLIERRHKETLRLKERPKRLQSRTCPKSAPMLAFREGKEGMHILEFWEQVGPHEKYAKPAGAARVELFVDLVPQGEKVPEHPAERTGRAWYLRSFTTSRMEVEFPMPSESMLVVYWARWADAKGEVGKWSETCVARVEGWDARLALPAEAGVQRVETKYVFVHSPYALTGKLEESGRRSEPLRKKEKLLLEGRQ